MVQLPRGSGFVLAQEGLAKLPIEDRIFGEPTLGASVAPPRDDDERWWGLGGDDRQSFEHEQRLKDVHAPIVGSASC